ncbi:hypothetical protein D3797_020015 [Bacillus subtilis]|uniref:hypothetical protein n=1 Tax=Bacillus inaquosorum TaxID=483913 RepID=UPI000E7608A0|nr:hypothetical protein [Bacillus inaquosorum]MCY9068482.1 hypothetical protein [Bacillus inaquosorum]RKQ22031.1 hypothetical protein D3797_020015 [Bacillus subtilis]
MLIKIDESIVDYIERERCKPEDSTIVALNNLAKAHQEGNHIVIASVSTLEKIINYTVLDNSTIFIYKSILSKVSTLGAYQKVLSDYIITSITKEIKVETSNEKNIYYVPIDYFQKYQRLNKTVLICENPVDYKFYLGLAKKYLKSETDYNLDLSYSMANGGGDTTHQVLEHHMKENEIILIVSDSDKKYSTDNYGETQKKIQKVYNENKRKCICYLINLDVREMENLVSPSLYMLSEGSEGRNKLDFMLNIENDEGLVETLRYFDWKDGIRYKNLNNKNILEYFKPVIEIYSAFQSISVSIDDYPVIQKNNREEVLIPGFGSKITERFTHYVLNDGLEERLAKMKMMSGLPLKNIEDFENKIEIKNELFKNSPEYIKNDQIKICKKLIAWGCREKTVAI